MMKKEKKNEAAAPFVEKVTKIEEKQEKIMGKRSPILDESLPEGDVEVVRALQG